MPLPCTRGENSLTPRNTCKTSTLSPSIYLGRLSQRAGEYLSKPDARDSPRKAHKFLASVIRAG